MGFTFFATHYPPLTDNFPITFDYSENNSKKIESLKTHASDIFIHSGNWWSMKHPEERTTDAILESAKKLQQTIKLAKSQSRILGVMSCNTQPSASIKKKPSDSNPDNGNSEIPYWMDKPEKSEPYVEESLKNANDALDKVDEVFQIKVPIYCTLQVVDEAQAERYYQKALDAGHKYFAMGVSELLSEPKYKFEGIKKILKITHMVKKIVGKHDFHLSGLSSFNLIPFAYKFGASSCDGSTPVQSALAYGSVFNSQGFGQSASALIRSVDALLKNKVVQEQNPMKKSVKIPQTPVFKWFLPENEQNRCQCAVCNLQSPINRIKFFNEGNKDFSAAECRVIHNLFVWNRLITQMNLELHKDPEKWIANFIKSQNTPYLRKIQQIANGIQQ